MRNNEIPIIIKKGSPYRENTQFGGANEGFMRAAYHVGMAGIVNTEPRTPASRHMAMLMINLIDSAYLLIVI